MSLTLRGNAFVLCVEISVGVCSWFYLVRHEGPLFINVDKNITTDRVGHLTYAHKRTPEKHTSFTLHFTWPAWFLFKAHTFPCVSLILHCLFLLWSAAIFLQGLDCALPNNRLPPELTVVDDFDDNGRHVEVFTREPLEMKVDYQDSASPPEC